MKTKFFTLLLASLLCISAVYKIQSFGLTAPSPVGSYINGNLPTESQVSWAAVKATPNLAFSKILSLGSEPLTNNIFVTDRFGGVYYYDDNLQVNTHTQFLDISSKIWHENGQIGHVQETGIYNLAFHPEFNQEGSPNKNYFISFISLRSAGSKNFESVDLPAPTGVQPRIPTLRCCSLIKTCIITITTEEGDWFLEMMDFYISPLAI